MQFLQAITFDLANTVTSRNRYPTPVLLRRTLAAFGIIALMASCNSVNSFYDSVVGAGEKPVQPPLFKAQTGLQPAKLGVGEIKVTAPPKGTVLLQGSTKYGIRNYVATYALQDDASPAFLNLANEKFELGKSSSAKATLDADISFQVHTGSSFMCKVTWETTATVALKVSIAEPAKPLTAKTYTSSVKDSLCAAAGVQLFPSAEAVRDIMQRAFDETAAKALAGV